MADLLARLNTDQKAKPDFSFVCQEKEDILDVASKVTVRRSRNYQENDDEINMPTTIIMQMLEKINVTLMKLKHAPRLNSHYHLHKMK